MNLQELAERHQYDYEGYELVNWFDAAFPFLHVHLTVLTIEDLPLPMVDRFVLRAIQLGLKEVVEIAGALGLEHLIVQQTLERLNRSGYLVIVPSRDQQSVHITLTEKGHHVLQTLLFSQPTEELFHICQDLTTGEYHPHRYLSTRAQIKENDLFQLPPYHTKSPSIDSLDITTLRTLWKSSEYGSQEKNEKNLTSLLSVDKSYPGYYPMRVLQFMRKADEDIQIQVYDNAERSPAHEKVMRRMYDEGARIFKEAASLEPLDKSYSHERYISSNFSPETLAKAQERLATRSTIKKEMGRIRSAEADIAQERSEENAELIELRRQIEQLQAQLNALEKDTAEADILTMVEHRPKLIDVLAKAKVRVIIVSPWLRPAAVNYELLSAMKSALKRGVEISIGFGYDDNRDEDQRSLMALQQLRQPQKKQNKLYLYRMNSSHAKVLIWDDTSMIITSFNWLSFGGNRRSGERIEFGTIVREPVKVKQMLLELQPLFNSAERV